MNKKSENMTALEYWNDNKFQLANQRALACFAEDKCPYYDLEKCFKNCKCSDIRQRYCNSLRDYTRLMVQLDPFLKDKPFDKLSAEDIRFALASLRDKEGAEYAEATIAKFSTPLSLMFAYAAARGDAANNTMEALHGCYWPNVVRGTGAKHIDRRYFFMKSDIPANTSSEEAKKRRKRIKRVLSKKGYKVKSLTPWQMEKLTSYLWKHINDDGRYCLIVLMIYTGVRPAEGRGLLWGDLVSFLDHPEDYLLNIEKYRQPDSTELVFFLKTDNGYRRIPVHPELLLFLKKRLEFVRSQCPGKDMSQMPICCNGNDFDIPCKDYEVAKKAAEIFKMIQMKEEDLEVYRLLWELEPEIYDDGVAREQHLHLYVLRRFFLNCLIAHTLLDKLEKLYLMGHKMMANNKNVRPQYNDENRLYEMYQMMSQCLINRELHEEQITIRFDGGTTPLVDNAGIRHLVIPEELRRTGGTLIISVTTEETDDAVYLDVSESIPLDVSGAKVTAMTQKKNPSRVNCEWENWSAHKDPEQSAPEDDISEEDLSTK